MHRIIAVYIPSLLSRGGTNNHVRFCSHLRSRQCAIQQQSLLRLLQAISRVDELYESYRRGFHRNTASTDATLVHFCPVTFGQRC